MAALVVYTTLKLRYEGNDKEKEALYPLWQRFLGTRSASCLLWTYLSETKDMTSFSIIIPSYNQQEFLPDSIESALEQTFEANEVIVIDDGSTDQSLQVALTYAKAHPKLKVISQVNKGLASARNTGILNSSCDYVLPLDADDQLMPHCLEKMTAVAEETKADIIAPSFKNFGVINFPVILESPPSLEDFKTANRIPYFSAIRREALLECGGYSPRMTWGYEDYALWFDLLSRGKTLAVIKDVLVLYRTKTESMLTKAVQHHDELMTQIVKDFPEIFTL